MLKGGALQLFHVTYFPLSPVAISFLSKYMVTILIIDIKCELFNSSSHLICQYHALRLSKIPSNWYQFHWHVHSSIIIYNYIFSLILGPVLFFFHFTYVYWVALLLFMLDKWSAFIDRVVNLQVQLFYVCW